MSDEHFDLVVLGGGIVGLWTARVAARAGARVAVVEVGPATVSAQRDATPPIQFAARTNVGALRARNHVLTGNSSYWGGGLVRNSRAALTDLYGSETASAVEAEYPNVENALGVQEGFEPAAIAVANRTLHEVAVLPGKRRGLWADFREPGVTCLTSSQVTNVRFGPNHAVERLTVSSEGKEHQLLAPAIAVSMGVLDSNLFVQRWLSSALPESVRPLLGTRLHDHWSVPVAALAWRASPSIDALFPPKFRAGVVTGRRLALERAFFHVVADLDNTPPYDRVKELMRVRQQGKGTLAVLKAAAGTMGAPFQMLRAGIHYLARHELHIRDGSEVRLVLDFESSRALDNRIVASGSEAMLHWDLHDDDRLHFESALRDNRAWWDALWKDAGIDARWLFDEWSTTTMHRYVTEHAVDAYHLGGGLHPDTPTTEGVSEPNGRLRGCSNVFVNGTAFYSRPGPANPVLTLLARASLYVSEIAKGAFGS